MHVSREHLWRKFVTDMVVARDDPLAAERQQRALLARSTATVRGREPGPNDRKKEEPGMDRAYDREYLAVDRKRLRQV